MIDVLWYRAALGPSPETMAAITSCSELPCLKRISVSDDAFETSIYILDKHLADRLGFHRREIAPQLIEERFVCNAQRRCLGLRLRQQRTNNRVLLVEMSVR